MTKHARYSKPAMAFFGDQALAELSTPWAIEQLPGPLFVRSARNCRSMIATAARSVYANRPAGLVVSIGSLQESHRNSRSFEPLPRLSRCLVPRLSHDRE